VEVEVAVEHQMGVEVAEEHQMEVEVVGQEVEELPHPL